MAEQRHPDEFFSADDLRSLGSDDLRPKQEEQARHAAALAEAKRKVIEEMRQPITVTDEIRRRILNRLKGAATSGQTSLQVMRPPSDHCTDQGRAIHAGRADWPEPLDGRPKQFFQIWKEELQPRGYRLCAEGLDYPDGMPGDIGLILKWGDAGSAPGLEPRL